MTNYWESKFRVGGAIWSFEPSDSAMISVEEFKKKGLINILIPGIGYGRNARLFIDKGFIITGIEISESAINVARANNIDCIIHHGSVNDMPFDSKVYDAVFCYALIHLLNKHERKHFLNSCFNQIKTNGLMIFIVTSKKMDRFGKGRYLSKDRFEIEPGLKVFFYDSDSIVREFSPFGLVEFREIEEPVKFMEGVDPLRLYFVICRKGNLK
jgi:predicted SAM-dependent methyltransferase